MNNVAETTYGLWSRYKFDDGALKGLAIGVGVSHLSKRAITSNNNATLYGWLDPYTVCDLMLSYDRARCATASTWTIFSTPPTRLPFATKA